MEAGRENCGANIATEKTNIGVWGATSQCKQTDSSFHGETWDFRRWGKFYAEPTMLTNVKKMTKCVTGEIGSTTANETKVVGTPQLPKLLNLTQSLSGQRRSLILTL